MSGRKGVLAAGLGVLALLASSLTADAVTVTLQEGNAVVQIDPHSPAGMFFWTVNGINQLNQQWFWYRVGSSGPEAPLNALAPVTVVQPLPNLVTLTYTSPQVRVEVLYVLTSGVPGSYTADVAETIRFTNRTTSPLDLHFWQYTDFDLEGTPGDDTVTVLGNTVRQTGSTIAIAETIVTPWPTNFEAALHGQTLAKLNDGVASNLNGYAGPLTGNVTWTYQWDFVLPALGSYIISKDKLFEVVPEPLTLVSMGLGVAVVAARARRR